MPWARPGSGFTLLFELLVLQLCREMSVAGVGELVGEYSYRIWRILEHYVERARRTVDLSLFHIRGMDEFSVRKGHNYMTSFSDIDASLVIFVAESRRKEVVSEFTKDLKQRGYDPERIDLICCDMWDAYLNGIRSHLPQASVVFDRFHIMKQMNKALEKVRWAEQKTNKDLKTARAYHIKLALARFWDIEDPHEAETYLKKWYFWATHSRLAPVIEVARGIKKYWQGVINYTKSRITNGVVEGLNSKIKTAMKRAYGFKQTQYLKTIVYLVVGKLCFE